MECDCDGQHIIEDVNKCARLLRENPNKFILGVRDFNNKDIPFRSRFGNKCTNFVFRFFCGLDLKDTQTGLKGFNKMMIPLLMEVQGERFEYASSVLLATKTAGIDIIQFPIQTIYLNGNETSHFNPLVDSIRIYSLIVKYCLSSLMASIVDITVFSIAVAILKNRVDSYILIASFLGAIVAGCFNFWFNRRVVFKSDGNVWSQGVKYVVTVLSHAVLSGFLVMIFTRYLRIPETFIKIIVDCVLFFLVFQIQDKWIFKGARNG